MIPELSRLEREVLVEVCKRPVLAIWKLLHALRATRAEIERALKGLYEKGLIEAKPGGWEPTEPGRRLAEFSEGIEEVEHSRLVIKPLISPDYHVYQNIGHAAWEVRPFLGGM